MKRDGSQTTASTSIVESISPSNKHEDRSESSSPSINKEGTNLSSLIENIFEEDGI
jgi:hypothetical protein